MTRFCTRCGNSLPAETAFCDACGHPVAAAQAAPAYSPPAPKRAPKRALLFGGIGLLCLLLTGGAAFFLLSESEPPTGSALARLLNADKTFQESRTCLSNFDYGADPAYVSPWDQRTQNWLQVLVDAGLYAAPDHVTTGSGFFSQERLRYVRTPELKKAVHDRRLCFADGITVTAMRYAPLLQQGDRRLARGDLSYGYENPAAWTATESARALLPDMFGETEHTATVYLDKTGSTDWRLLSPDEGRIAERQMTSGNRTQAESGSVWKLAEVFTGLFQSSPAQAIMGQWTSTPGGSKIDAEFTPDSMMLDGRKSGVIYEVNGNRIVAKASSGRDKLNLVVVSEDEIHLDIGLGELPLYRIR